MNWGDLEALRDELTGIFTRAADKTDSDVQNIGLSLGDTNATVTTMQGQLTTIQASLQQLTATVAGLRVAANRPQDHHADDDSAHGALP